MSMKKILVVGQTPPPYGGQAIMIRYLLQGAYQDVKLFHVRMSFSKDMDNMGSFTIGKLFHLIHLILKIIYARLRHGIQVLYYPPCGPDMIPMLRDLAILCSTRWMFKKTIFHFHAAGISDIYQGLPTLLKIFYRWGYFKPELAIQISEYNPDDGQILLAKKKIVVPNGLEDDYASMLRVARKKHDTCTILFVGLISESKGILVLLEAIKNLAIRNVFVQLNVVGKFESRIFESIVLKKIGEYNISDCVNFKGVLDGLYKHHEYLAADIFCFPTFFESESFGLVVAEAMQFKLPVIASQWRGVQSLVSENKTGFLTPIQSPELIAEKIELLVFDPELRRNMGVAGRLRFIEEYSLEKFHERMGRCFSEI